MKRSRRIEKGAGIEKGLKNRGKRKRIKKDEKERVSQEKI